MNHDREPSKPEKPLTDFERAEIRTEHFNWLRHIARAALESVGYQTRDLMEAMKGDMGENAQSGTLRVDGGMTASDWAMQFLSDILGAEVDRPKVLESTAIGAAWLAGMRAGVYPAMEDFAKGWARDRQFAPTMDADTRSSKYAGWKKAVEATLSV